jgi:hypothetical protein
LDINHFLVSMYERILVKPSSFATMRLTWNMSPTYCALIFGNCHRNARTISSLYQQLPSSTVMELLFATWWLQHSCESFVCNIDAHAIGKVLICFSQGVLDTPQWEPSTLSSLGSGKCSTSSSLGSDICKYK